MKLLFSEEKADYARYRYSYVIWAVPEAGETPADLFNAGFLPASRTLDRFYLVRQIRVDLAQFHPSSENRRVLRQGVNVKLELVPRAEFDYTPARREFFKSYADRRFGADIMTYDRLDGLFNAPVISHLLVFSDGRTGAEIGVAVMYLEGARLAYYYYAFYDLNFPVRNLGMFMMTSAAELFAGRGCRHLYLGTCYSERALYKTQFAGVEFFNGVRWSKELAELKRLLRRDQETGPPHLLETEDYQAAYYPGGIGEMAEASGFRVETGLSASGSSKFQAPSTREAPSSESMANPPRANQD